MVNSVTKESLAARIADLEYGPRSLKEDYTLVAYKMLLATMEAEPVYQIRIYGAWADTVEGEFNCSDPEDRRILYKSQQPAPVVPVVPDENVSFHRLPGESEYDRLNRQREWMESKSKLAKVTAAAPDDLTERLLRLRAQATLDGSYLDTEGWDSLACDVIKALNACRAAMLQVVPGESRCSTKAPAK